MMDEKLKIIQELMEELKESMEYDSDDFDSRLGRKPKTRGVEIVKIEGSEDPEMEHEEEMLGEDLDHDMEMGEDPEHAAMVMDRGEEMSPEEKLKDRILKMRG